MADKDNLFVLKRCIKLAREQALYAARDAEAHHVICRVHGPDTDEVDVRAVERSLSERSWLVGELARGALGQLESRGIDSTTTYLQAAEDGAERDLALFMDEGNGPLVALLTDAVQHLEKAEQAATTSADTAGSHLALATIQAQLVAMLLGVVESRT